MRSSRLALVMVLASLACAEPPDGSAGSLLPLGDGQAAVERFGRGRTDLSGWELSQDNPPEAAAWTRELSWFTVRLARRGPGKLLARRAYDLDVTDYRTLVLRGASDPATTLTVTALYEGGARTSALLSDQGLAVLPVQGTRLRGLELRAEATATGRKPAEQDHAVELEWLVLRPREVIRATAQVFANRAVLLSWRRPWWGAERYYVARERTPIARTDRALAVSAGRSGATPWLVDAPPESGPWHYAVAPVEASGLGLASPIEVTLGAQPVPSLIYADFPITIDGDLSDWQDRPAGPPLLLTPTLGHVQGEAPRDEADLSASVRLARDSDRLYLGAVVRDELRAHPASSLGDGLTLALGAARAERDGSLPRYALVLNYAASDPPAGRILEDAWRVYPADARPPAPGTLALKPTPDGYVLEAMLPLSALATYGLNPAADGWLALGLTLLDRDESTGETTLSWNQRQPLTTSADAGLVRVERYP